MKMKQFLLYDNSTNDKTTFMDLIILDKECEREEIENAIEYCKNKDFEENGFYTYTNEEIYNAIEEKCGSFKIIFLGNLEQFDY